MMTESPEQLRAAIAKYRALELEADEALASRRDLYEKIHDAHRRQREAERALERLRDPSWRRRNLKEESKQTRIIEASKAEKRRLQDRMAEIDERANALVGLREGCQDFLTKGGATIDELEVAVMVDTAAEDHQPDQSKEAS